VTDLRPIALCTNPSYSEAWRYTGPFSRWNRFKGLFPGLGIATDAFTAYCAYEHFFLKDDHHHGDGHGEAHH
jgi:NADH dehydrogenase (ubiquinone) 1 beta subcomplex subunit 3